MPAVQPDNVLFCLRYGIGDVIMELPVLSALREALPHARITALATPPADELLDGDPRVDEVAVTARWRLSHRWDEGDADTRADIGRWLVDHEFDVVIDAVHSPSAVEAAIRRSRVPQLRSDGPVEEAVIAAGGSGVESILAGARAGWGLTAPRTLKPRLHIRPRHERAADRLLEDAGLAGERPFVVSPVASHELKRWAPERFAAVADRAVEEWGAPVLVLEGPDAEAGMQVVEAMRHPAFAVRMGPQHLLCTAAVLQRTRAVVCNDTGIMHLASAAGVPTVAVFGPTAPGIFLPPAAHASGLEPTVACEYRATSSSAPPACWASGECLLGIGGCIDETTPDQVMEGLHNVVDLDVKLVRT